MPLEISDFPEEVQEAFFIYSFLEDNWEGMSGSYMGKLWSSLDIYLKLYPVATDEKVVVYFMKQIERLTVRYRAEEAHQKRQAEQRRAKAGSGKNYTHNVRG
jgi:hypothetical protein